MFCSSLSEKQKHVCTFIAHRCFDWLFLAQTQVNYPKPLIRRDPKEIPKGIKGMLIPNQLPPGRWPLTWFNEENRYVKAIGKSAEATRETYEDSYIINSKDD